MAKQFVSKRLLASCGVILAATISAAAQQQPVDMTGKTAEQVYKNIQVLKGVPADQVVPGMRVIAGSLGVGCTFCHVADRSKDDLETKQTARKMMAMMMAINKSSFNGEQNVTCFTCHNGSNQPASTMRFAEVAIPPAPAAGAGAAAEGRGGRGGAEGGRGAAAEPLAGPSAAQILANYVQALGGEQAIRKVSSLSITATRAAGPAAGGGAGAAGGFGAGQGQVEVYLKAPNLMVTIVHTPNGMTTSNGFDGKTGWTQDQRGTVTDLTSTDEARAARDADFYEALDLSKEYSQLMTDGTAKVGDHDAYVVIGTTQGGGPERLFFDTTTGLLLRKIAVVPTPFGGAPTQIDFDDYRDGGNGVKYPFMVRVSDTPNARVTTYVQKIESVPVDSSKFAKPQSKAAQAQ
jgi:photosynthetic reaction center cytochrome c subunit